MLAGHLDVVPTEGQNWTYPAFDGLEEEGFIYGRGTIDAKQIVFVSVLFFFFVFRIFKNLGASQSCKNLV